MNRKIIILIIVAVFLKGALFLFSALNVPEMKIRNDSHWYLESGLSIVDQGAFGKTEDDGSFTYQYYRTPGYPLFLGILHGMFKIPLNGIIVLQILLTLCSAIIVYKTANILDPKLGTLSFLIMLFDPSITIHSLMILTESLFLFLISIFMYVMIIYLKKQEKKHLFIAALALAAATYVRPISLYLGAFLAPFILCVNLPKGLKKSIAHVFIFIITVYSLLFLWHWRNYTHFHEFQFTNIGNSTIQSQGIYKSYSNNQDPISQDLPPISYYVNVTSRCLLSLYTRPVSMKYFESQPIKRAGKILSYLWIAFWLSGFIRGLSKMKPSKLPASRREVSRKGFIPEDVIPTSRGGGVSAEAMHNNRYFYFFLLVILYLTIMSIMGIMWMADGRFRVPMMPYIAIISAYGWRWLRRRPS